MNLHSGLWGLDMIKFANCLSRENKSPAELNRMPAVNDLPRQTPSLFSCWHHMSNSVPVQTVYIWFAAPPLCFAEWDRIRMLSPNLADPRINTPKRSLNFTLKNKLQPECSQGQLPLHLGRHGKEMQKKKTQIAATSRDPADVYKMLRLVLLL